MYLQTVFVMTSLKLHCVSKIRTLLRCLFLSVVYSTKVSSELIQQLNGLLCNASQRMVIILLVMEQFQKGIFILTKFTFLKVLKQELRRIRSAVLIIFGKSNSKSRSHQGKRKILLTLRTVATENQVLNISLMKISNVESLIGP